MQHPNHDTLLAIYNVWLVCHLIALFAEWYIIRHRQVKP